MGAIAGPGLIAGNLASVHYEQNNLELAIIHYKQAILLDSTFLEAYNNLVSFMYHFSVQYHSRLLNVVEDCTILYHHIETLHAFVYYRAMH